MRPIGWGESDYPHFWKYLYEDCTAITYIYDRQLTDQERIAFLKLCGRDGLTIADVLGESHTQNLLIDRDSIDRWWFAADRQSVSLGERAILGFEQGLMSAHLLRQQVLFPAACGWSALKKRFAKGPEEAHVIANKFAHLAYGTATLPPESVPPAAAQAG